MLRRAIPVLAVLAGAVAAPAAASAATVYTVDPNSGQATCSTTATTCRTIASALAATADGDSVRIADGQYTEGNLTVADKNLTIAAVNPGKARITGTGSDPVLTVGVYAESCVDVILVCLPTGDSEPDAAGGTGSGSGTVIDGITLIAQSTQALLIKAANVTFRNGIIGRVAAGTGPLVETDPLITAGATTFSKALIADLTTGSGGAILTPSGSNSTIVEDTTISLGGGTPLSIGGQDSATSGARSNQVIRSQANSKGSGANILDIGGTATGVSLDSSALVGVGAGEGASIRAVSGATPITVNGVHVTLAGSTLATNLSGDSANSVNVVGSIVRPVGSQTKVKNTGGSVLNISQSDTNLASGDGTGVQNTTNTPDDQLFGDLANFNIHLKPGTPNVIDKYSAPTSNQSKTDLDGDPRVSGAASDYGADEFTPHAPIAALLAPAKTQFLQNEAVTLDASKSTDPDPGDALKYHWEFGDGEVADTDTPTVTHAYKVIGPVNPKVTVTDKTNLQSVSDGSLVLQIVDGTPPVVTIGSPKNKTSVRGFKTTVKKTKNKKTGRTKRTKTVKRVAIKFAGTAVDELSGVQRVIVAIQRVKLATSGAKAAAKSTPCTWLDKSAARFVAGTCQKPKSFFAKLGADGKWSFTLSAKTKIKKGTYKLFVAAIDGGGVPSSPVTATFTVV